VKAIKKNGRKIEVVKMKYLTSKTWFDYASTSKYESWMAAINPIVNSINTLQKTEELYTPYRATFCMPKISDYSYTKVQAINKSNNTRYDAMETVITFANGDKVTVSCPIEEANQYTGFYTAIAKYAMGNSNKVNNEADYWINKLPKQKAKTEEKARRLKEQAKNIKRKKERRLKKEREDMEAKRLADKYKIKLIANKKYGVPLDFEP
jgi:hypothetical protein